MVEHHTLRAQYSKLVSQTKRLLLQEHAAGSWIDGEPEAYAFFKARAANKTAAPSAAPKPSVTKAPTSPIAAAVKPQAKPKPAPPQRKLPAAAPSAPETTRIEPEFKLDTSPRSAQADNHDLKSLLQQVAPQLQVQDTPRARHPHVDSNSKSHAQLLIVLGGAPSLPQRTLLRDLRHALHMQGFSSTCVVYVEASWPQTLTQLKERPLYAALIPEELQHSLASQLPTSTQILTLPSLEGLVQSPDFKSDLWNKVSSVL